MHSKNINSISPTVFIIDDDVEILKALKWLLESVKLNVKCFENSMDFLNQYDASARGCIVTDVRMPILSGLQLLEKLNGTNNSLPVILITGHGDISMAVKAMKMGATDFISKPFNDQILLEKIQLAIASDLKKQNSLIQHKKPPVIKKLSKRENEIMELISQGMLNKQIAQILNISISTVEFHRARLMRKMGVRNLAQLVKAYLLIDKKELV